MTDGNAPLIGNEAHNGLSKREYFAAMIMQGMLANPLVNALNKNKGWNLSGTALAHADDLINELNKNEDQ